MTVSVRVREIETEIDERIRNLEVWRQPKAHLLEQIMGAYRDAMEVIVLSHLFVATQDADLALSCDRLGVLFAEEQRLRAGALWSLKWGLQFCPENGVASAVEPEVLVGLFDLGAKYVAFVDTLKAADQGDVIVRVDESEYLLRCYEGEEATPWDAAVVVQQRVTVPLARQISLTEDHDQLTSGWTAGDYRRVTKSLTAAAARDEDRLVVPLRAMSGQGTGDIALPRPTIVWLEEPTGSGDFPVFRDLILSFGGRKTPWTLVSLLDTPIVKVADRYCALSSDLRTITDADEHMLRLAVLVDQDQYSRATILREARMIARCVAVLEDGTPPWDATSRVRYDNPPQEADLVAVRRSETLVIELKSTLRPETPWEVRKRNDDIVRGIKQTKALLDRGVAGRGFVITDGYRGDYACWAEALSNDVMIGTLGDLAKIASDPVEAILSLKKEVGLRTEDVRPHERLPDREIELMGWKLRLIDGAAPSVAGL